jgi:hypothetical protein
MKKLLLSSVLALTSVFAFAQNDISVTLNAPTAGANLNSGTDFTFDITVTNSGTTPILATDSILYAPTFAGSLIGTTGGGSLIYLGQQAIAAGGTANFQQTLNLTGGTDGMVEVCGIAVVLGPNWSNVTEDDTTNNQSCATVNWSTGTIGTQEFRLTSLEDNSFYSNGTYSVRLTSAGGYGSMNFELISLTGQVVQASTFSTTGSEVNEDIQVSAPTSGIYIARLTANGEAISTKKVIVQ